MNVGAVLNAEINSASWTSVGLVPWSSEYEIGNAGINVLVNPTLYLSAEVFHPSSDFQKVIQSIPNCQLLRFLGWNGAKRNASRGIILFFSNVGRFVRGEDRLGCRFQ